MNNNDNNNNNNDNILDEEEESTTADLEMNVPAAKAPPQRQQKPKKLLYSVYDVLKEANTMTKKEDKLKVLRDNDTKALRYVLQASYDNNVQSILPDGEPPYTPKRDSDLTLNAFESEIPKLFKHGPMSNEPITKVEFFFIDLLSKLQKEEAMVLIRMKDKLLQQMFKKLTKPIVREFLSDTVQIK